MPHSTATTPTALAGTLVTIECNASAENNVSNDSSGKLYQIKADNSLNTDLPAYVKIVDAASATVGTTNPDIMIEVPAGETAHYVVEAGWTYSSGLSVWCTSGPESISNSPMGNSVSVALLAST